MAGTKKYSLTIVIPAFNEARRIVSTLSDIDKFISEENLTDSYKVLVVSDGSTDNTNEVVSRWINLHCKNKISFELYSYTPNKGKGYAIREGFLRSKTDLVMYSDADGASSVHELSKLLSFIDEGYDVVCGSRILRDREVKVKMGIKRRIVGLVFHVILRVLGLANLMDTQCGFKLFKKEVVDKIIQEQKCFNYSFDVEYLFLAKLYGCKVKEVAVNWEHIHGSKVSILRDSVKMLLEVLKIRFVYKYNIPRGQEIRSRKKVC